MKEQTLKTYIVKLTVGLDSGTPTFISEGLTVEPVQAKQPVSGGKIYTTGDVPLKSVGFDILAIKDEMVNDSDVIMEYEVEPEKELSYPQLLTYMDNVIKPSLAWIIASTIQRTMDINKRVEDAYEANPTAFHNAALQLEAQDAQS